MVVFVTKVVECSVVVNLVLEGDVDELVVGNLKLELVVTFEVVSSQLEEEICEYDTIVGLFVDSEI